MDTLPLKMKIEITRYEHLSSNYCKITKKIVMIKLLIGLYLDGK